MSHPPHERRLIATTVVAHAIVHICELSFPAIQLMVAADLLGKGPEYSKLGFAYFIAALIFGAMALPAGFLVDRIGQRRVLLIYLFGAGASMILIGLAQEYFSLVVALGLMGGFIGLYHPTGASLLSLGTERHGSSMGIHGVGGNFGLALSPVLASGLAVLLGWRTAFIVLGLLPLAFGVWVIFDRSIAVESNPKTSGEVRQGNSKKKYLLLPLLFLFLMAGLNGMCYRGFTTFLPVYFKTAIPNGTIPGLGGIFQAGSFTTLVLVVGMVSQYLGGRLSDRFSKEKIFTLVFLLSAPFMFLVSRSSGVPLVLFAMGFAFLYFANQPIANAILPKYVSESMRGRIYGWFFFMNFGAGSIMSWIAGVVADKLNLASIFAILAGLILLTGISGFGLILAAVSKK